MSKFCTACGASVQENVKFCTGCGAPVISEALGEEAERGTSPMVSPETVKKEAEQGTPGILSPALAKTATQLLHTSRAPATVGEISLPQEMFSLPVPEVVNSFVVLGSGARQLLANTQAALRDKKRLIPALVLAVLWIVLIFLPRAGTDAVPVKILSWLTFAQGGLNGGLISKIGGILGKGLLAAFFTSLIIDKSTLGQMKAGLSAVTGGLKGYKATRASWLLGTALALILYNIMVGSTSLHNSMAAIACLGLSLRGLAGGGSFARQFFTSVFYKKPVNNASINPFMGGWGAGFALAFVCSVLPGGFNGYIGGAVLLVSAGIAKAVGRKNKEVPA
ncbi:MAG: zinc ribbon domain-containing protein [Desulfitobacteriaceae bacterium]|nr:zinc ribbon domain-containing protein [Desulfitobacteriaceae bacterium]